jgi:hypothetical protein
MQRCKKCLAIRSHGGRGKAAVKCPGQSELLADLMVEGPARGHEIWVASVVDPGAPQQDDGFIVCCMRCGGYTEGWQPKGLMGQCRQPCRFGRAALSRIRKGLFPMAKARYAGVGLAGLIPMAGAAEAEDSE